MIDSKSLKQKTPIDWESGEAILVRKPVGWSSFDVVNKIKKALRIKKIGHTGTLDPFASGLLILVTGKMTRQAAQFQNMPKTYEGVVVLGETTDTLDIEGKIIESKEVPPLTSEKIQVVLENFLGEGLQTPPAFSALKVAGKRAYKLARQQKEVHLEPRRVHIYNLDLLDFEKEELTIRVTCSKGTYVRALARDIALALGTVGYLKTLTRTKIGPYSVETAVGVDELIDTVKAKQQNGRAPFQSEGSAGGIL